MQPVAVSLSLLGTLVLGAVALGVLVRAAGVVVDRATRLATSFDVDEELVAMTVVALGTSLPEIATGVIASAGILAGTLDPVVASATVLGSNTGSSTVQQLLLFGIFLVGYGRLDLTTSFVRARYLPMLGSLALLLVLSADGHLSRLEGLVLVGAYGAYFAYSYTRRQRTRGLPEARSATPGRDAAVGAAALVAVLVASFVVLDTVDVVVQRLALGGSMLGVVTIGVAAALPELSVVREAIRRRTPTLALGTLVGSNVVNSLVGLGLGATISTYQVPQSVILWDLPFKLLVGVGLLVQVRQRSGGLGRGEGTTLLVLYLVFIAGRLLLFAGQ
ncbi:sodium:calcium antiporter [Haloglomus salinum]|uniref:sodium:calcium antiporter n=1 Tax=Haloglomus salinum TaxID=2962673 RepID=UPI003313147E